MLIISLRFLDFGLIGYDRRLQPFLLPKALTHAVYFLLRGDKRQFM